MVHPPRRFKSDEYSMSLKIHLDRSNEKYTVAMEPLNAEVSII